MNELIKAHIERVRNYDNTSSVKLDLELGLDIYYHEGVDRLVYLTYNRAYHEEEGSWVFLSSNPETVKTSGLLKQIKRFLI